MLLDVRQRTNQENSTFVTDAELTEYLNQELAELWTRLVLNQGQPHFRSSTTIPVVPPTTLYALPSDFWTLQEVTATANGVTGTMQSFGLTEHGPLTSAGIYAPWGPARYRVQAGNIEFLPASESFTATVYYSPCQPRLTTGSDTFDGFNGYEVAAIYGVCATVLAKEETDPSFYMGLKQGIYRTIEAAAASRDMANPERVADVSNEGFPGRFGWWG
jgi:hypothetical protein